MPRYPAPLLLLASAAIALAAGCATPRAGSQHELVGYVMDPDRIPITNARVQVLVDGDVQGGEKPAEAVQISDIGGAFVVRDLLRPGGVEPLEPDRSYKIVVEEPDYRIWEGRIAFRGGLHEVEIELENVLDTIEDTRAVDPDAVDPMMEGQIREGT